jgi:capsular polysaccharide biosynthesis protein
MTYPLVVHRDQVPPEVLGAMQPTWRRRWFASRPVTQTIHDNVYVAGEGLVFTADLEVVPASIGQHQPHHIDQARAAIQSASNIPRHAGTTVLCKKSGAYHYGHWLLELLPRAYFARPHGPARYLLHAVDEPLRTVMRQSLACLDIMPEACIETGSEPIRIERLVSVDGLTEHGGYMSPLVMQCMDAITRNIQPVEPRKIFVTRPKGADRCLVNQGYIEYLAPKYGYFVLDPAKLPFVEQVAHFKSATEIVGIAGSALSSLAFAQPGTRARNIAPATMPDTFFWFISGLRGLDYTEIRCATAPQGLHRQPPKTAHAADLIPGPGDLELMFGVHRPLPVGDPDWPELGAHLYPLFDTDFYTAQRATTAGSVAELLDHYDRHGWREGLDPSPLFSTVRYLKANPDVADAGVNPLMHYIQYGHSDGRPLAVPE